MKRRRQPEMIAGQISAAGVLLSCNDPRTSVVKFSTGQNDITFPADFKVLAVHIEGNGTAVTAALNFPTGSQSWRLYTQSPPGTNADVGVGFTAFGVQQ